MNGKVDVVLDSGSDATIVPASFKGVGIPVKSSGQLWDSQGAAVKIVSSWLVTMMR